MKYSLFSTAFATLLTASALSASAQTTPKPSTRPAQTTPRTGSTTASSVERDLGIFREWVNDKLDRAEVGARRDLPRVMEEFDYQSRRIDKAVDSLTVHSKREYDGLKDRYKTWQLEQERLNSQARQPETAQQVQNRILGENVIISRVRPSEIHDLYGRFIEYARANRKQWTTTDWVDASNVLGKLNQRYDQVREQVEMDERLRIRSWQAEFRTLEKARQAKDATAD